MPRIRNKTKVASKLIGAWASEEVNKRFENALATKPDKSKSSLVVEILTEWMDANGY
jgi:hypothetical protein